MLQKLIAVTLLSQTVDAVLIQLHKLPEAHFILSHLGRHFTQKLQIRLITLRYSQGGGLVQRESMEVARGVGTGKQVSVMCAQTFDCLAETRNFGHK